ncbi:hypothetical protein [Methylomagnum sp.]
MRNLLFLLAETCWAKARGAVWKCLQNPVQEREVDWLFYKNQFKVNDLYFLAQYMLKNSTGVWRST